MLYRNYSGRYGNCSDMGIIQAVPGNIQADEVQNYVFFLLFVCSLIFGIYAEHSYFFIFLLFCFFCSFHLTLYGNTTTYPTTPTYVDTYVCTWVRTYLTT
jgi:hypothetical protein